MKYIVSINDKNYEVEVERGEATIVKTTRAVQVQQTPSAPAAAAAVPAPVSAAPVIVGEGEPLKAPMPGTILSVRIGSGATVKRGEILLILEAMKMENEIVAPRDGVITQILTSKGASVNTGDVLVMLK